LVTGEETTCETSPHADVCCSSRCFRPRHSIDVAKPFAGVEQILLSRIEPLRDVATKANDPTPTVQFMAGKEPSRIASGVGEYCRCARNLVPMC
jgi:hypothetical protein